MVPGVALLSRLDRHKTGEPLTCRGAAKPPHLRSLPQRPDDRQSRSAESLPFVRVASAAGPHSWTVNFGVISCNITVPVIRWPPSVIYAAAVRRALAAWDGWCTPG